jgi:hypothetical protein
VPTRYYGPGSQDERSRPQRRPEKIFDIVTIARMLVGRSHQDAVEGTPALTLTVDSQHNPQDHQPPNMTFINSPLLAYAVLQCNSTTCTVLSKYLLG